MDEYMFVLINSKLVLKGLHFGIGNVIMGRLLVNTSNMYWNGICQTDLKLLVL